MCAEAKRDAASIFRDLFPRKSAGAPVRVLFAGNESWEAESLVTAGLTFLCSGVGRQGVHFAPELTGAAPRKCLNTTCHSGGQRRELPPCTCSVRNPATPTANIVCSTPPLPPPASFFPSLSSRLLPSHTSAHLRNPETPQTPRVHGAGCPSTVSTFILNIYIHTVLFVCCAEWSHRFQALHRHQVTPESPEEKAAAASKGEGGPEAALLPSSGLREVWIMTRKRTQKKKKKKKENVSVSLSGAITHSTVLRIYIAMNSSMEHHLLF